MKIYQYFKYFLFIPFLLHNTLFAENFKFSKEPKISSQEEHSFSVAKKFINGKDKSFYREDGSVVFIHGASLPSILTAPLRITDIQFQEGEIIKEIQLGDTVRWRITPSLSGTSPHEISHIVVKPTDVGLETTLVVFTNKRSYSLNLKSTTSKYFPVVSFAYKDEQESAWSSYHEKTKDRLTPQPSSNEISSELDFGYDIEGKASWKPITVYNDGKKTYIQMPKSMLNKEAPALLVLDEYGDDKLVNYRVLKDKFIVDKVFSKAILILGVGYKQEKITISKFEER
jgi:type IV secretion system protein VirB9